jgi:hypothetical protein
MSEKEFILKNELLKIVFGFKRPFTNRDVISLIKYVIPENKNTLATFQSYIKNMIGTQLRKTGWNQYAKPNFLLPIFPEEQKHKIIRFSNMIDYNYFDENIRSDVNLQMITTYIKPIDLIDLANSYAFIPYSANKVMNGLKNFFLNEISYEYAMTYNIFTRFNQITIMGYKDRFDNHEITTNEFSIKVDLNNDHKPFMVISGEFIFEMLRKIFLVHSITKEKSLLTKLEQPLLVNVIIQEFRDPETTKEILNTIYLRNDIFESRNKEILQSNIFNSVNK